MVNQAIEEHVTEVTDLAAQLAEVIRREAGHPLRQLSQVEVERHFEPVMKAIESLPKPTGPAAVPSIQPLLAGAR